MELLAGTEQGQSMTSAQAALACSSGVQPHLTLAALSWRLLEKPQFDGCTVWVSRHCTPHTFSLHGKSCASCIDCASCKVSSPSVTPVFTQRVNTHRITDVI